MVGRLALVFADGCHLGVAGNVILADVPETQQPDERATLARSRPAIGVVHRAEATGYVSLFFTGGRTSVVRLLVGWQDPPTECICEANTRNGLNSYAGGIVRKGEYWILDSKHGDRSGFECVFTPLF